MSESGSAAQLPSVHVSPNETSPSGLISPYNANRGNKGGGEALVDEFIGLMDEGKVEELRLLQQQMSLLFSPPVYVSL
jgi:hypothetical protein